LSGRFLACPAGERMAFADRLIEEVLLLAEKEDN